MVAPETPAGQMRAWRVHEWGQPLDVLQLDTIPIPEPGPGEVRVKVAAIPLNLNDLERITGGNMMVIPPLPCIPGMEVMGVVDACGEGTESWLGKRVVSTTNGATGGYAEYTLCGTVSMFEMPDDIPLPDAAALYFPFHLAWLGLFERGGLQAGESVLIHAAAGGAGSAAVQLAANAGARVFATAGSAEKLELCRELGADVLINYREQDFAEVVLAETSNRGVDVVFDNVVAGIFEQTLKCTAYNGRLAMMGFAGDKTKADEPFIIPRKVMAAKHQALRGFDVLRGTRDGGDRQADDGLQLPVPRSRAADQRLHHRAGPGEDGAPDHRPAEPVRGAPRRRSRRWAHRDTTGRIIITL